LRFFLPVRYYSALPQRRAKGGFFCLEPFAAKMMCHFQLAHRLKKTTTSCFFTTQDAIQ
jgi:hypothetical protein